ncbi:YIP1 family protein [Patescibacteria group bacterium]|nr:YIP1 family protein [Patescibacteria group bacterium]MBU1472194.1 YIP1 family protein [Patescibacteria group bacterium]MBU2459588.1 YIP1 family protein [Patescibacteria group bacterium]MBU2544171.1 YIP1 family protein [Patescibacteria group bacterium]
MVDNFLVAIVSVARTSVGLIMRPYETYRRLTQKANLWEALSIWVILAIYFAAVSLVKTAAFLPFYLSRQFIVIFSASVGGYLLATVLLWVSARILGGKGSLRQVAVAWAYTLIPTLLWFWFAMLLWLILPPPRTTSVLGIGFSIVFIAISTAILFWKILLSYLVLRFGMRLDLLRISIAFAIVIPILTFYSVVMFRMGIFKVPFI